MVDTASFLIGYAVGIISMTAMLLIISWLNKDNHREEPDEPWPW